MSDLITAARPYAKAAFDFAKEKNSLEAVSSMLNFCAAVLDNQEMQSLIANPKLNLAQQTEIVLAVCKDKIDNSGINLLKLLAENKRLDTMTEIAQEFDALKAQAEGTVEAVVVAAQAVSDEYLTKIGTALEKRLGQKVSITTEIDESLIGGAIVRAGDLVIDGSLNGRLNQLAISMGR